MCLTTSSAVASNWSNILSGEFLNQTRDVFTASSFEHEKSNRDIIYPFVTRNASGEAFIQITTNYSDEEIRQMTLLQRHRDGSHAVLAEHFDENGTAFFESVPDGYVLPVRQSWQLDALSLKIILANGEIRTEPVHQEIVKPIKEIGIKPMSSPICAGIAYLVFKAITYVVKGLGKRAKPITKKDKKKAWQDAEHWNCAKLGKKTNKINGRFYCSFVTT